MGDKSPPKKQKPQTRSGKGFTYEVVLLDGEHVNIELDKNADGKDLLDKVCQHLDLSEKDYFGLQYVDDRIPHPLKCWLSPEKKISKQKKRGPWLFDFALKFYPPDPTQLRESLTRWLVVLQTRRDILNGKLPATFLTQAMLGSYCVQADIGDYESKEHHGTDYVKEIPFVANQTTELLDKIVELHKQHKGQTPDEAEINYLENSKKLSMYGVDLHAAQDVNNVEIMIGVCASGLQVYRDKLRISRFVWPKILKISYKRNHFYIKVRPLDNSRMENSVSFKLESHRLAKRLWKICVEHHAFFRLREAEQPNNAAMFPRLGSKFRYSGRTLYQARHSSQTLDRPDPYFERSQPARNTYAAPSNRSRSVDELTNRPDYWRDDLDAEVKRRPSDGREGRDKRDHMGQPTVISMLGLPEGMKPVESEQGRELEPGANRSRDGKDRKDLKPGEEDTTLEREGMQGTMGLTPAELQKKEKEDEKERKKREKEEEKKRKKEEEEKKKAAKKGKGKGATDPMAEDRTDHMAGGDATERAPGRTSGTHGDEEGEPIRFDVIAPVGQGFTPGEKGKGKDKGSRSPRSPRDSDKDRWSPLKDGTDPYSAQWEPGTVPEVEMRNRSAPGSKDPEDDDENKERFSTFKDPGGNERWSFNKERPKSGQDARSPNRDKDGRSPGRDGDDRDRHAPGRDGDGRDRYAPGRDGDDRDRHAPGRDGNDMDIHAPGRDGDGRDRHAPGRDGDGRDRYAPGRDGDDRDRHAPGRDGDDRDRHAPGRDGDGRDRYAPGRDGDDRDRHAPGRDGDGRDRHAPGRDGDGRDGRSPGRDGDQWSPGRDNQGRFFPDGDRREPYSPGHEGANRDRYAPGYAPGVYEKEPYSPGRDGDKAGWEPGREVRGPYPPYGKRDSRGPGQDGDDIRRAPGDGRYRELPPGREGEDRRYFGPEDSPTDSNPDRWGPGVVLVDFDDKDRKDSDKEDDKDAKKKDGKDSDKDKDKKKKKGHKDSDKEDDKDKKKKKGRKDSDKEEKDAKKDKKKGKKDKDRKGSDKDEEKKEKGADKDDKKHKHKDEDKKHKDEDKENEKDKKKGKDGDKPGKDDKEKKGGGLFGKFKKPKDSKSKLPEEEDHTRPEYSPEQDPRTGQVYPERADVARTQGGAYPGFKPEAYPGFKPRYAPGLGVGAGDMSGVVGEEKWVDNKMSFQPIVPPKKESKESLKCPGTRLSGIDQTMPFFSPAATSTVGRPRSGKVPPPISPKPNSSFDDSFSRRDPPTVATESVQYQPDLEEVPVPTKNVPLVKTETRTVTYEREGFPFDSEEDGVLVSARSHSTRMQTIETTTYKTEKDGVQETRVEHRVVLSSNDDDFDYDAALAEAIRSVTEFNPDMSVERIECVQQIEEVKDK
ncbi:hypothetical protein ACOMHN_029461 [Nucella lapillus]